MIYDINDPSTYRAVPMRIYVDGVRVLSHITYADTDQGIVRYHNSELESIDGNKMKFKEHELHGEVTVEIMMISK